MAQRGIDCEPAGVSGDLGVSVHCGHEGRPFEIYLSWAATIAIVDRFGGAFHHRHSINRNFSVRLIGSIGLSVRFLRGSRIAVSRLLAGWRWILIVRRGWGGPLLGAKRQECESGESQRKNQITFHTRVPD